MGLKSGDKWAVPLCHGCHMDLHTGGTSEDVWWAMIGVDAKAWAETTYREWKNDQQKT